MAKNARTEAERQFFEALEFLNAGRELLMQFDPPDENDPTVDDLELAKLFADLWGIQGGIYRDMIRLDVKYAPNAVQAYDCGADYEERFALLSTYNRVNQLVIRLLNEPDLLQDASRHLVLTSRSAEPRSISLEQLLHRTEVEVNETVPQRQDPAWAYADLLLLRSLQPAGDDSGSRKDLERQVRMDGQTYPYESLLQVVRELASFPSPVASKLVGLGEWLRQRIAPGKRGDPLVSPR